VFCVPGLGSTPLRHQQNKEFKSNWPLQSGEAKIVWWLFWWLFAIDGKKLVLPEPIADDFTSRLCSLSALLLDLLRIVDGLRLLCVINPAN
jgi:hypothetical protein